MKEKLYRLTKTLYINKIKYLISLSFYSVFSLVILLLIGQSSQVNKKNLIFDILPSFLEYAEGKNYYFPLLVFLITLAFSVLASYYKIKNLYVTRKYRLIVFKMPFMLTYLLGLTLLWHVVYSLCNLLYSTQSYPSIYTSISCFIFATISFFVDLSRFEPIENKVINYRETHNSFIEIRKILSRLRKRDISDSISIEELNGCFFKIKIILGKMVNNLDKNLSYENDFDDIKNVIEVSSVVNSFKSLVDKEKPGYVLEIVKEVLSNDPNIATKGIHSEHYDDVANFLYG